MDVQLVYRPGYAAACVKLAPAESFVAEGGSMIALSADTQVTTTTHQRGGGGVFRAIKRALGGESFFLNHYQAGPGGGDVWLAPDLPGDVEVLDLYGNGVIVQGGSFVACEQTVGMDMSWQGFAKAMFSGEGMFWLRCAGQGKLIINSFGAIYPLDINGEYVVDTGHIVAFEETLNFKISKAGKSWVSSFLGGEGLICRFSGQGRAWCQSHNPGALGQALAPNLRAR